MTRREATGDAPLVVSVITAVYNGAAEIRTTLESVASQTYEAVEHIVVDGASRDGTAELVRQHGKRVARLVSEPDRGVYDAFDKGLRLATGDIVCYLNAGDVYASADSLAHAVAAFAENAGVDAVIGDVDIVDPERRTRVVRRYRCGDFRPERLRWGFMPAHPAMFVRRTAYARIGGYDHTYRISGDFEFCVRAFCVHQIPYVHVSRVFVRMPRGGLSSSGWRSNWTITREMLRACRSHDIRTSYPRLIARLPVKALEVLRGD